MCNVPNGLKPFGTNHCKTATGFIPVVIGGIITMGFIPIDQNKVSNSPTPD